ncbi:hypothetical protein R9X47_18205 [Wukongibacter baidiensis]|uniref:hypothetical protein n=1 Tax=Wukongibacter baidiensis TaxID=1723361 RepID=UPI003D7FA6A9
MIIIMESKIQFRNPQVGQSTRACEAHYNGRRVKAIVDGEEKLYRFKSDELSFYATEDDMIVAIESREKTTNY